MTQKQKQPDDLVRIDCRIPRRLQDALKETAKREDRKFRMVVQRALEKALTERGKAS